MKKGSQRSWVGAAFGLMFVIAGLAATHFTAGKMISGYLSSTDWVEVPAEIHDLELVSKHVKTTTYTIKSTYSYQYNGNTYNNNRVSINSGSDNLGDYWHQLHRSLNNNRSSNTATALVNPNNPAEAVLDRTFRWNAIIFGALFLTLFSGIGSFFTWICLRRSPPIEERLKQERLNGIASDQKHGSWILGGFGAVFFVLGAGISALALPRALRNGDYPALFVLVFVIVGAGIMAYAFKSNRAYRKIGPTPLFLDPQLPGVGGQLGGTFEINIPAETLPTSHSNSLHASLHCIKKRRSRNNTYCTALWHEETAVHLEQSSSGYRAQFVFEIPETCQPTADLSHGSTIEWQVVVDGQLGNDPSKSDQSGTEHTANDKFERSWQVKVAETAAPSGSSIVIPVNFTQSAKKATAARAKSSALTQIIVDEGDEYINIVSKAGRQLGSKLLGMVVGLIFAGVGGFAVLKGVWPGYIFLLIGSLIALSILYSLGKAVEVKIDKDSRILYSRESWMGLVYTHKKGDVRDSAQFKIKKTSSLQSGTKVIEYFALNFDTGSTTIRIGDGIEGERAAQALIAEIIERIFQDEQIPNAA